MYNLPSFKEKKSDRLLKFMQDYSFVVLTGTGEHGRPVATQVPVLFDELDGRAILTGHFMRNTDHHNAFVANPHLLVLFLGPHCYVSARWYTNPATASTWNYMTAQIQGTIEFLEPDALPDILRRTTEKYEADATSEASFDKIDPEYVERLAKAIVGFRIHVDALDHVFKLSQNKNAVEYQQIIAKLSTGTPGEKAIAEEMRIRQEEIGVPSFHQ